MIPINNVTPNRSSAGFLVMKFPFEKDDVIHILGEMGIKLDTVSKESIQYFVMEEPEEFLERYTQIKYDKGTLSRAEINEEDNAIYYISNFGYLTLIKQQIHFAFRKGSLLYKFNSDVGIEYLFIPAEYKDEIYKKYEKD